MTLAIEKRPPPRPRRTLLYGVQGIGKSTFAAMSESPIFIQTEDGIGDINCDRLALVTSYDQFINQLKAIYTEKHTYRTLVVDSLDWLERLIQTHVCELLKIKAIGDADHGKGYVRAVCVWSEVLVGFDALRADRNMAVLLIAHAEIESFSDPETETYDRYGPRLQRGVSALVREWCDEVLFASYPIATRRVKEGFGIDRAIAMSTGDRVLRTQERPSCMAKNRLNLPPEIPLDYAAYSVLRDQSTSPKTPNKKEKNTNG